MSGEQIIVLSRNDEKLVNLAEFNVINYELAVPETDDPYKIELMSSDFDEPIQAAATMEVTEDNFVKPNVLPSVFCLVCNKNNKHFNGEFLNVDDSKNVTKYSKKTIKFTMGSLLGTNKLNHSDTICTDCYELLNEWDYHLSEVKKIQANVLQWYRDACSQRTLTKQPTDGGPALLEEKTAPSKSNNDPDYKPYFYFRTKHMKRRNMLKRKAMLSSCNNQSDLGENSTEKQANSDDDGRESSEKENNSGNILIPNTSKEKLDDVLMFCGYCTYSALSMEDYRKHKDGHYCKMCKLFVKRPAQLRLHLQMAHNVHEPTPLNLKLTCKLCSKKYSSKGSLYTHRKTVHSKKRYPCDICNKSFPHPRILQAHKVRHVGKTVHCDKCTAVFYLNTELAKHINQVHNKVRPYECHLCLKHFCQRSVLNHHLSQHVEPKDTQQPRQAFVKVQTVKAVAPPQDCPPTLPQPKPEADISTAIKTEAAPTDNSVSPMKLNYEAWQLLNSSIDLNVGQDEPGPITLGEASKNVSPLFSSEQMQDVESAMALLAGNDTNLTFADLDASVVESMLGNDYFFVST